MNRVTRIIFAVGEGLSRGPMAAALFGELYDNKDIEVLSRGIHVAFEEPLNPKAEVVMIGNGMDITGFTAKPLMDYEITDRTMIFTMGKKDREEILENFESAGEENVRILSEYVGDELEIMDPYGGTLQSYGLCFELIKSTVEKLISLIETDGLFVREPGLVAETEKTEEAEEQPVAEASPQALMDQEQAPLQ